MAVNDVDRAEVPCAETSLPSKRSFPALNPLKPATRSHHTGEATHGNDRRPEN
jgi:hypothetical protein